MTDIQNTESNLDEWVAQLKAYGWCWFEDDKPRPHLWNHKVDAKSSLENMLIRATKAGLNKADARIAIEKKLPLVSGTRFMPDKPEFILQNGCYYVNTFKTYTGKSIMEIDDEILPLEELYLPEDQMLHKYAVEPFLELIDRLTINQEDNDWIMGWLAHMVQRPEERPSVHPLFRTEHGVGKNVLVEKVMNKLLCGQTVTTSLREIRGAHSESATSNLLVFVDESKAKGMNVYLELKSLLTTSEALVNPKHIRPYKQPVFSRFMFADNTQGRAFNIEQEDRRIYVLEYVIHESDKEETQQFIGKFLDWFNVHWQLVYGYLLNYDISSWSPHVCPMTKAKRDYLGMCEDPVSVLLQEYIESGWQSLDSYRWDSLVLKYELDERYSWSKITCTEGFKYQLEDAGFVKRRVGITRSTGYFLNNLVGKIAYDILMDEKERFEAESESTVNFPAEGYTV